MLTTFALKSLLAVVIIPFPLPLFNIVDNWPLYMSISKCHGQTDGRRDRADQIDLLVCHYKRCLVYISNLRFVFVDRVRVCFAFFLDRFLRQFFTIRWLRMVVCRVNKARLTQTRKINKSTAKKSYLLFARRKSLRMGTHFFRSLSPLPLQGCEVGDGEMGWGW